MGNKTLSKIVENARMRERKEILEILHHYVATGDPALIRGVDQAIRLIEDKEQILRNAQMFADWFKAMEKETHE